jgi:hypothetical protein
VLLGGWQPRFIHSASVALRDSGLTGFYTSRPGMKGYVRETSSYHQAARQLQFAAGGATSAGPTNPLYQLETTMGVVQHHDAVSGTEKQHVRAATPGSRGGGGMCRLCRWGEWGMDAQPMDRFPS